MKTDSRLGLSLEFVGYELCRLDRPHRDVRRFYPSRFSRRSQDDCKKPCATFSRRKVFSTCVQGTLMIVFFVARLSSLWLTRQKDKSVAALPKESIPG